MTKSIERSIDGSDIMHNLAVLLAGTRTASGYVRSIATHSLLGTHALGAELFLVNQNASLTSLASFGKTAWQGGEPLSIWEQNPISEAARTSKVVKAVQSDPLSGEELNLYCYPFSTPTHTVGVLVMIKSKPYDLDLEDQDQQTISMFGGLWLESLGLDAKSDQANTAVTESRELTERQLQVLKKMSHGKTNAQIAEELILSESTIRQETVKIYRKLSVADRVQATKRAISLGIIDGAGI